MGEKAKAEVAELEERTKGVKALLNFRRTYLDSFKKTVETQLMAKTDYQLLMAELDPMREVVNELERKRIQLVIERDLPDYRPSPAARTDVKMDAVLNELRELRREVQELKKK